MTENREMPLRPLQVRTKKAVVILFFGKGKVNVLVGVIMIKYENSRGSLPKIHAYDGIFFQKC